ncbi:MAG TPA: DUF4266 domain-containing protein [Steroidobacteraceae bacterium]|jgi:hypothetical protein
MRPPFVAHWLKVAGGRGPVTALDAAAQRAALGRSTVRFRTSLVAISALVALSACSPIQPWVKPYEREHLADPIMALDRNPVSSTYLDHVLETREGARGATGAVGGGCGCN